MNRHFRRIAAAVAAGPALFISIPSAAHADTWGNGPSYTHNTYERHAHAGPNGAEDYTRNNYTNSEAGDTGDSSNGGLLGGVLGIL